MITEGKSNIEYGVWCFSYYVEIHVHNINYVINAGTCGNELKFIYSKIDVETLDKPFVFTASTFKVC